MYLNMLQEELQQMAEAIMSVTALDVTIMDRNLKRIAGTGRHRLTVGEFAPRNSVFEKCIKTGQKYVVKEPRTGTECRKCQGKSYCSEKAEVCYPIKSNGDVEGVIGMIAFTEEQKKTFIENEKSYMNFVSRMSHLISSRIKEQILNEELRYKSIELKTIIDAVDEGIIAIDDKKKILCINKRARNILGVGGRNVKGKDLDKLLPQNSVTEVLRKNEDIENQEEVLNIKGRDFRFLLSAKPIIFNHKKAGAVATFKDFNELHRSILKINESSNSITFDDILGESPSFVRVKEQANRVAKEDVTVLLIGESGTGKELFARAIHNASQRKNEVFVPINCGAIPDSLIESELFGYERGAFTGANPKGKIGKFEMANKGTIFLDEIGDIPLHMQVKLLRVLQERKIVKVGGLSPIDVDVRVIAATNKNLWKMVKSGEFREDLYYRLNVIPIEIPPLRERPEDILALAKKFLERYSKIYKKDIKSISKKAQKLMLSHSWPGNVRELENLIEYGVIFEKGNSLTDATLLKKMPHRLNGKTKSKASLKEMVAEYEKNIIINKLKRHGHDLRAKEKVASELGISLPTLYRKLNS